MIDDEFDDIFRMMDRIFGMSPYHNRTPIHDRKYERLMDDDYIYYTFELPDMRKDDIDIQSFEDKILVTFLRNGLENKHQMNLPYPIHKDETKVTFKNGILDITVKINKEKANKIKIEE